ncbi:sigma-54 dependent transcriptional regulator [Desulfuromonas carbonis]|uniref:sigma-54-dependent transcriptional regulator n=1 Tax=Desulfuromonas sp. DDH964 TaxID=1823759 RepID=UPI00078E0C4D|nr:sigma-54 dependent transcriptional regulator [Desulfuromonas sp. DDH964]AMV72483.1 sigma-54-dependent transcriptional response regulator [Desulfuromonas sp. DDH964]
MPPVNSTEKMILLVDDEPHILATGRLCLQGANVGQIETLDDSREVLSFFAMRPPSVIVLDLHMPHLSGAELLPRIVRDYPQVPVILVTANDDIATVVDCMKSGAFDYLVKPVEPSRLIASVRKALEVSSLSSELQSLKQRLLFDQLDHPEAFSAIVTGDKKLRALFQYVEVVAKTRAPIMISGETGTGKELFARAIHTLSGCKGEFVPLNVAGLDDNLFTDTLFGHKKGAFTGADQAREGLIAKAAGGTLFLDEIGDLNEASQIKLLRLLQEQEYYPVGSDLIRKSDARIVLATNRDLQELINAGRFRNDLYYRLFAHRIHIPPLRERGEDIPLLLDHFLAVAATSLHKKKPTPPPELAVLLSLYTFPGNIRELEALVFDAVARHESGVLSMDSFRNIIGEQQTGGATVPSSEEAEGNPLIEFFGHFPTLDEVESYLIEQAMARTRGNQGMAAKLLGMGRQTLNKRLKKKGG